MKYDVLTTEQQVRDLIAWHNANSPWVVVDIETTGLDPWKDEIVDVQISGRFEESVIIFRGALASALRDLQVRPVGHNLRFDVTFLVRKGHTFALSWKYHDTMLLAHLENENRVSYSLDALLKEFYDESHKEAFWAKYKNYTDAPEAERYEYGAQDVRNTARLYRDLTARLRSGGIPPELIEHVHRLQYSLLKTEIEGIAVDTAHLTKIGVELTSAMDALDPQLRACAPTEIDAIEVEMWADELASFKTEKKRATVERPAFSFGSTNQLQHLLYDKLGLPIQYNQKTRNVSTDYDALVKIQDAHPIVPLLLKYREYPVVYNTFIVGTTEKMRDGRIYPEFRVNGTKGARISHCNPNMGNIPTKGGIKGIFIPDEGYEFSELDYAQLEVCIEAHLTQDKNLLDIVCNGASKHDITAHGLGIPRPLAKTVNFAMQYFCGPNKVASILGCSKADGQLAWNKFWETYPGPKKLKAESDARIDDGLPLIDLFGRQRRFPKMRRQPWAKDYRSGYNFLVQSPGAQMMNNACYLANEQLRARDAGKIVLTVHDSALVSTRKTHTEYWVPRVGRIMVQQGVDAKLTVPLKVSSSIGMPRWLDK